MPAPADVTGLLIRWSEGDEEALGELLPYVYEECRRIAASQLRNERPGHTLSPTALVHEVYVHLVDQRRARWHNRAQFYSVAARLMRRVLVDHARARSRKKRDPRNLAIRAPDESPALDRDERIANVLAIDEALERLGAIDSEQQRIVELRFFGGLSVEETAAALGIAPRTVKRDWALARAWLYDALQEHRDDR